MNFPHEIQEEGWYLLFLSDTVSGAMHKHKNGAFYGLDFEIGGCAKCKTPLKKSYLWMLLSSKHKDITL